MMNIEKASGRHPPNAKNVIPITESGIRKVCPEIKNTTLQNITIGFLWYIHVTF